MLWVRYGIRRVLSFVWMVWVVCCAYICVGWVVVGRLFVRRKLVSGVSLFLLRRLILDPLLTLLIILFRKNKWDYSVWYIYFSLWSINYPNWGILLVSNIARGGLLLWFHVAGVPLWGSNWRVYTMNNIGRDYDNGIRALKAFPDHSLLRKYDF